MGHDRLRVAVNVPPDLLTDADFPALLATHVREAGLHSHQLVLEITEEDLVDNPDTVRSVTEDLQEQGFRLALDDFGTGYSSLRHLRSIPLHALKINRDFISDIDTNARSRRFLRALLAMGRDLGLRVIAQGVERQTQADILRDLGATHGQGDLYARPAPPEELKLSIS